MELRLAGQTLYRDGFMTIPSQTIWAAGQCVLHVPVLNTEKIHLLCNGLSLTAEQVKNWAKFYWTAPHKNQCANQVCICSMMVAQWVLNSLTMNACLRIMKYFSKIHINRTNSDGTMIIHHILSIVNPIICTGISNIKSTWER